MIDMEGGGGVVARSHVWSMDPPSPDSWHKKSHAKSSSSSWSWRVDGNPRFLSKESDNEILNIGFVS